jgi:NAD(P)-dependent dehydrogenase (short-subunit alcohol dehydrogenase family)
VRAALVIGASSGIGLEFVRQFLESGSRVAAGSRRAEDSKDLQQLKVEHGDRLLVHRLDVGDEESRVRFLRFASDELDYLDLLVENVWAATRTATTRSPIRSGSSRNLGGTGCSPQMFARTGSRASMRLD